MVCKDARAPHLAIAFVRRYHAALLCILPPPARAYGAENRLSAQFLDCFPHASWGVAGYAICGFYAMPRGKRYSARG